MFTIKRRALPKALTIPAVKKVAQAVVKYQIKEISGYRGARKKSNRELIIADMTRIHNVPKTKIREELRKMGK